VISRGISAPCPTGLSEEAAGGLVVVAEGVCDDGSGHLKELLSDGGAAGGGGRDPDFAEECGQVIGAGRLSCPAAGEKGRR
jgi:hypothetical protein